jgi:hypothetical protein
MKKGVIVLVLVLIVASGVFAQSANAVSNWISGEVSLLGAGVRYERMLTPNWSIGANAYWSSLFFFWNELGIDVSARYYPWGKIFFAGLGLGFHQHWGTFSFRDTDLYGGSYTWFGVITGAAITPEVGWKIDVGSAGKFFLQPGIKLPITLGSLKEYNGHGGGFRVGFGITPYFGLGYAF